MLRLGIINNFMSASHSSNHTWNMSPNTKSKDCSKINIVRKQLLDIMFKGINNKKRFQNDPSPSVTFQIKNPILRSNNHSRVCHMGSTKDFMPLKFFPSASSKLIESNNKSKINLLFDKDYRPRRVSISIRKLNHLNGLSINSGLKPVDEHKNENNFDLETKQENLHTSKRCEIVRRAMDHLRKCAISSRIALKNCLVQQPIMNLVSHSEKSFGELRVQKNDDSFKPKIEPSQKISSAYKYTSTLSLLCKKTETRKTMKRRFTTPNDSYNKFTDETFEALRALALQPVIKLQFEI